MIYRRGLFITFEGTDGLGKSTNLNYFSDLARKRGLSVEISREPGGTPLGEDIRTILIDGSLDSMNSMTELLLILAARASHITSKIEPALAAGKWFLCDRFSDATYAYQGGGRKIDKRIIMQLEKLTNVGLTPDFTFLFDAPPEVGLSRAINRGEPDRFEKEELEFYRRVRSAYLNLAKRNSEHKLLIDATQSIASIQKILIKQFNLLLSSW
mgnify:FL=1